MDKSRFSIKSRIYSFKYAFAGLKVLLKEEHNSRIHLAAAIAVVIAGFYFRISRMEWIALVLCISSVIVAEMFNTAIEDICDFISPGKHEKIKRIKDLASAAVLFCAITAVVVGLIIFLPRII